MDRADAIELAEQWLEATGQRLNQPDGVRVERDAVGRVPEGWFVPYGNVAFLDHGDSGKEIFPPPALVVTVPDGRLRFANTTPHPGFSAPVNWPGESRYSEIIDPEYREAGLHELGVPSNKVAAWEITHPDGRTEERVNPNFAPGPLRAGLPRHRNRLEALLNYLRMEQIDREKFVAGLFRAEVLVPLELGQEVPSEDAAPFREGDPVRVYSSSRRIPRSLRWWRMTVPTFVGKFPGRSMEINHGFDPSATVPSEELAAAFETFPNFREAPLFQPQPPVLETEPGMAGELDEQARRLQQQFQLPEPPELRKGWILEARRSGHDLTWDERSKLLLGSAWVTGNKSLSGVGYSSLYSARDDISRESWPADLHANGLVALHDQAGRVRPEVSTFGKFPRMGGEDPFTSWQAVVGAYVGFAVGDALGSAVDTLSWDEIRQRYGEAGITDLQIAFERPGQVSWRTQLLLFVTEAAIRAQNADELLAMRSSHARWLVTQGLTWEQAAGPLVAEHAGPDGWLVRVPELHAQRGASQQLLKVLRAVIAEPGTDHGLTGPMLLSWGVPSGLGRGAGLPGLVQGWHKAPLDAAATSGLSELIAGLFTKQPTVHSSWMAIAALSGRTHASEAGQRVSDVLKDVKRRLFRFFHYDNNEIEQIGTGQDTLSVLGRALFAAARRETDPRTALRVAVNHSGRSAMTGALAGAVVGARAGVAGLPPDWVEALDLGDLVQELADEAFWAFAHRNVYRQDFPEIWQQRYPGW